MWNKDIFSWPFWQPWIQTSTNYSRTDRVNWNNIYFVYKRKWKSNYSCVLNKLWANWWIFYNRWQSFYKIHDFILPFMVCHICTTQLNNACKKNPFVLHTFMKNLLPTVSNHFSRISDNVYHFEPSTKNDDYQK